LSTRFSIRADNNLHRRTRRCIEILDEDIDRVAKHVREMKALPAPRKSRIGFNK